MFWVAELPTGETAWFVAPGQWFASTPDARQRIRTRLRADAYIAAVPLCPEFPTAEPVSAEALAAALIAEYGDVSLPPELGDRVVPSIPTGAVG